MKKAIGIIILGLLWCNVGVAEEFYIECIQTNYKIKANQTKFIFEINTLKKKMTLIEAPKGEQITEKFTKDRINLIIKDVKSYDFDSENKDLILSYVGDYKFHLNRISGKLDYLHSDPRKEDFQAFDMAQCERVEPKI